MDVKNSNNVIKDSGQCSKCASKIVKSANRVVAREKSVADVGRPKTSMKSLDSYVTQIVSIGVRSDNVYEARMLLAPEVDMSSIKITVKGNNLRVNVCKPLNDFLANQLFESGEKSVLYDLVKKTTKHCENLLVPDIIDGEKVRAVVDNKNRMLVLTAPAMKPSKARKRLVQNH